MQSGRLLPLLIQSRETGGLWKPLGCDFLIQHLLLIRQHPKLPTLDCFILGLDYYVHTGKNKHSLVWVLPGYSWLDLHISPLLSHLFLYICIYLSWFSVSNCPIIPTTSVKASLSSRHGSTKDQKDHSSDFHPLCHCPKLFCGPLWAVRILEEAIY